MKKQLNRIAAALLTGVMVISILPLSSSATPGTDEKVATSRRTGQVALYQDGALSEAYLEGEWTEQYTAPNPGTFEGDLYQGLKNFENPEDGIFLGDYHLPEEEGIERFQKLLNSNPDLFYVSNLASWYVYKYPWCDQCGGLVFEENGVWYAVDTAGYGGRCDHKPSHNSYDVIYSWAPYYITNDKSQLTAMTADFDAAVKRAMAGISASMSDFDKALYFHDYIVKSNNYDLKNFDNDTVPPVSHSAYGALVNRVSVCDGYALAYSYLLQQCGISTRLVTSNDMGHAWSAVELDGEWYFVDCTGDDAITRYTNADPSDQFDVVYHDTFLMSEKLMSKTWYSDSYYKGWAQTDIKATNEQYDKAVWRYVTEVRGDVSGNGIINSEDASLILKYDVGIAPPNLIGNIERVGDVTGNGIINSEDASLILKYDVGIVGDGDLRSDLLQPGITNEYGYCDGYWYYLDDATLDDKGVPIFEIRKTKDPAQAGDVYSSIIKDTKGTWPLSDNPGFYVSSFGKASVHTPSKKMYVSTKDTIYVIDLTGDGKAVPYLSYSDLGNTDGAYIYGLTVIDNTLYIGVANSPLEKETIIEKPIG